MQDAGKSKRLSAALVVIGDEILSGRTQDKNISHLAQRLGQQGIALDEVRVVPDIEARIVEAVNALRARNTYVFTTGGIGPTHDDITVDSIAVAFGVEVEVNADAFAILQAHYGESEFTEARQRMARIPIGAELIPNPVSAAPGFRIENVFVMAGVPRIMQAMLENIVATMLEEGERVYSNTVSCAIPESQMAPQVGALHNHHEAVSIGSYPYFNEGEVGVSLVLRSADRAALKEATAQLVQIIHNMGARPHDLFFEVE